MSNILSACSSYPEGIIYDLRQLRYFVAVAEERHFTRAAERCGVSQPPLSRQIALLEGRIGGRLFDRNQHGVTLTTLGVELLGDARRLLSAVDESADRLRRQAAGQAGRLRVGFGGSTLYSLLPRLIRRFADAYPNVSIDFRPMPVPAQIEALRDDVIDLGLLRLPVYDELLATRAIHCEPLIVAVPVDDALAQLTHPSLSDMARRRFVAYQRRRGFGYHNDLITLCASAGFAPNIVHEAATTEAIVGIVACGQGVAIVPEAAQRLTMDGVAFRYPRFPDSANASLTTVEFALAWRRDAPSAVARQFVAMVDCPDQHAPHE